MPNSVKLDHVDRPFIQSGGVNLSHYGRRPIAHMVHPEITTIKGWTSGGIAVLRPPIYEDLSSFVGLRNDAGLPVVYADRLAGAKGQYKLPGAINQISPVQAG
jgi:hypothetical protein